MNKIKKTTMVVLSVLLFVAPLMTARGRGGRSSFRAAGVRGSRGRAIAFSGRRGYNYGRGRGYYRHGYYGRGWRWGGSWYGTPWWNRWRYRPIWWTGVWPPVYYETITLEDRAVDDRGYRYWEVYNATDTTLTFYADNGTSLILAPGQRESVYRGRSFGFAVVSADGTLLNNGSSTNHFITLQQRGSAADYSN